MNIITKSTFLGILLFSSVGSPLMATRKQSSSSKGWLLGLGAGIAAIVSYATYRYFSSKKAVPSVLDSLHEGLKEANNRKDSYTAVIPLDQIEKKLQWYAEMSQKELSNTASWVAGSDELPKALCDLDQNVFKPYVQRLTIPADSEVAMWGDLHGSACSLLRTIKDLQTKGYMDEQLRITKDNFYITFLGDYVDRGYDGVEVLYTLMSLKHANPDRVFLVRGNHEDALVTKIYGFREEFLGKYKDKNALDRLQRWYDLLPVALYLGYQKGTTTDYLLCCHGGLEVGFDPKPLLSSSKGVQFQWLGELKRESGIAQLGSGSQKAIKEYIPEHWQKDFTPSAPMLLHRVTTNTIGFMWNDFIYENPDDIVRFGRSWKYGKPLTEEILKRDSDAKAGYNLVGVIRAHQYAGCVKSLLCEGHGFAPAWDGGVYTLFSAADSYSTFNWDHYTILKPLREEFHVNYRDKKLATGVFSTRVEKLVKLNTVDLRSSRSESCHKGLFSRQMLLTRAQS